MTPFASDPHAAPPALGVRTLRTAVILPTGRFFADEPASSDAAGPLTVVSGLTLIQRAILTLQRAGVSDVLILAGAQEAALKDVIFGDRRITALVRWMPVREFPLHDPKTWETLAHEIEGPCLIAGVQGVFSTGLIEQLKRGAEAGQLLVVAHPDEIPTRPPVAADLLAVPARFIGSPVWQAAVATHPDAPIRAMAEHARAEGRLATVAAAPGSSAWYTPVRSRSDVARVERLLLRSPKGSSEGLVDTYFNRRAANLLTGLFVKGGWSPNAVTLLSLAVGGLAAGCFALGGYTAGLIGAVCFQLSAVIDCCDGDVARLTFSESKFGEQLDLVGDNLVHMAIFAGLAWAGYAGGGGWLWPLLGLAAILGNGLSLWFVIRIKARRDRQGWASPVQAARGEFILKNMASRDFSVVVLVFALIDQLPLFLWLAAIGSNAFWMMTAWVQRAPTLRA
ncbi:CDP-alcohol phosphatidyltransferase family protein [Candidatus Nitrospira bockiana]